MKAAILSVLSLFLVTTFSFSQSKKIAVLLTSVEVGDEINYEQVIKPYIEDHLKKLPNVSLVAYAAQIPAKAKMKTKAATGDFLDNSLTKGAAAKGVDGLVLVYYDAEVIEKRVLEPGMESTSYGATIDFTVQIVNAATNQIISSKKFFCSIGRVLKDKENFKTKEEAAKAAIESPKFADEAKTTPANMDDYLKSAL